VTSLCTLRQELWTACVMRIIGIAKVIVWFNDTKSDDRKGVGG
jgi:hypothetical protein